MGIRVRAAIANNLQWSVHTAFNNKSEKLLGILLDNNIQVASLDNNDLEYSTVWEVNKEELDAYVQSLPEGSGEQIEFERLLREAVPDAYGNYLLLWY